MLDFLRRLLGRNRPDAPPRHGAHETAPPPTDDPEFQQVLDGIDRKWNDILQRERAAEALLTPRERIKKRLNLPTELSADSRAGEPVLVLSPVHIGAAIPMIVVVNDVGAGINMPRVLFEYLYCQGQLTTDDRRVINDCLKLWGLEPESL